VAGRVYPDHKAGRLPFLRSSFNFAEAGSGNVHRDGLEEAIQVAEGPEVLNGHLHLHLSDVIMKAASAGTKNK